MSIEAAKSLFERMKTDDEFAQKSAAYKNANAFIAFINESGYDCTQTEINKVKGELSDGDLENIAGGFPEHWACNII